MPSSPPEGVEFRLGDNDEYCPECGWDREPGSLDHNRAFNEGVLLAVEIGEGSPYTSMGGAQMVTLYWRCPHCATHFTTDEENVVGGMS